MKKLFLVSWIVFSTFQLSAQSVRQAAADVASEAALINGKASIANGTLTIEVKSAERDITPWLHVFLNFENSEAGYKHSSGNPNGDGLDMLFEGNIAYRFTGVDANAWSWEPIPGAEVERKIEGDTLILQVPLRSLELPSNLPINLFAASYSTDYAEPLDTLPHRGGSWKLKLDQTTPSK